MNRAIKFSFTVVCFFFLAGCQKERDFPVYSDIAERIFTAVTEGDGTKTLLADSLKVIWQKDDEVAIYEGRTEVSTYVVKKKDAGSARAVLTFDKAPSETGVAINDNVAYYPASEVISCSVNGSGYQVSVSLPSIQYYQTSSFGNGAMPMVAVSTGREDKHLRFKNLYGALRIKLKGNGYPVRRIIIKGNNNESLAGLATLQCSNSSLPSVSFSSTGSKTITLDCGEGVTLKTGTDTEFIVALPPITFTKGLTATIESTVGSTVKSVNSSVLITRNKIMPFASTTISGYFEITKLVDAGGNEFVPLGLCNNHYSFCLPDGTDMTKLKAIFEGDADGVYVGGVSQTSGVTVNDYTSDVTYTVSIKGENKSVIVSVYDFNLPALYLETPDQVAITSKEIWTAGTKVLLWDSSDNSISDLGISQLRGRGNSTWSKPKKPYTIKLDSKASILGMPSDKRWNLLANYVDRTMIRNAVAFHIAEHTTGLAWTPRGKYVELIFNGVHKGNYFLCEHIKAAKNRVNINEMKVSDVSGDAVTGGYILEFTIDNIPEFYTPFRKFPVNIKEPDDDVIQPEQIAYISDYFSRFENLLYKGVPGDCRDFIDLDSFVDWWLVYELAMNHEPEGGPKSCYMHKDKLGKVYAGPVWDFDLGTFIQKRAGAYQIKSSLYYPQLFTNYYFVSRLKEKWNGYMSSGALTAVCDYVDNLSESLRKSDVRNHAMWKLSAVSVNGDELDDYDTAISKLKNAYLSKVNWLNTQILNMELPPVPPAPQPQEGKDGSTTPFTDDQEHNW